MFKVKNFYKILFCIVLIGTIIFALILFPKISKTNKVYPLTNRVGTVVLDAGHGGVDGGCEGVETGQKESDLNLDIALKIKNLLEKANINVVLTRSTKDGLYSNFAKNKKHDEMKTREKIINSSNATLLVSIHANSFSSLKAKGAQVFFREGSEESVLMAENIKNSLIGSIKDAKKFALKGDYYVLNCTEIPAVLVEVGYLSNPEEDRLLKTNDYRNRMAYAIYCGIVTYIL